MITRPTTVDELQRIFAEILINKTSKVTKVSPDSVLSGIGYGVAKVGQKAIKDIGLVETHIFPDEAYSQYLDNIASDRGIAGRFGASESSTYIKVIGDPGTTYTQGIQSFSSTIDGITFSLESTVVISSEGFAFAKVRSSSTGSDTNIPANSIDKVAPIPTGHRFVTNEFGANGGRDEEQDVLFRRRIKEGANVLATGTISMLEQAFMRINPNVLRVINQGVNANGQPIVAIVTQNGIDLTSQELGDILDRSERFLSLTDLKPYGSQTVGLELKNIEYQPYDVNYRVELDPAVNPDDYRIEVQRKIAEYTDFRFWTPDRKVEWDDLLGIAKNVKGAKYIPDNFFNPAIDIRIDPNKLPRVRSFVIYDLDGNVISNASGSLDPLFYPNQEDLNLQLTVLTTV